MNPHLPSQKSRARNTRRGWTLIEMTIAVGAGMLILASVGSAYVFMRRTLDATSNYEELDRQSRNTLDKMTRDIRQCGALTNFDNYTLSFTNKDAAGSLLRYVYDPTAQTLSYTNAHNDANNSPEGGVLLTNCIYWVASKFTKVPYIGTTMTFNPLQTNDIPSSTKVIVLDWICRKTNVTTLTDSESVQTAKIVLRN